MVQLGDVGGLMGGRAGESWGAWTRKDNQAG